MAAFHALDQSLVRARRAASKPIARLQSPQALRWLTTVASLGSATHVWNLFAKGRRQIDLMVLLLHEDLANLLGYRVFPKRFTLTDAVAVIADGLVFVLEIIYPMLGLSGLFTPIDTLPPVGRAIARVLPFTYAVSLLRGVWHNEGWWRHRGNVATLALIFVVCIVITGRVFRWE
jgi:hypothetical protein